MLTAFVVILGITMVAAIVSFGVMSIRQFWRARVLARRCHERGWKFERFDPFDLPRRYQDFVLFAAGHTPRASNVAHGKFGPWTLHAFDYRYEVGHGPRRMTRRYSVVVMDTAMLLPELLLWNQADAPAAPLEVRRLDGQTQDWAYRGDDTLAHLLGEELAGLAADGVNVQTQGCLLMAALPFAHRRHWDYTAWVDRLETLPACLEMIEEELAQLATARVRLVEV